MSNHQHSITKSKAERIGIFVTVLCAIHCVATPVIITVMPLFGASLLSNPIWEWLLIGVSLGLAVLILAKDFISKHKNTLPLLVLGGGFSTKALGLLVVGHSSYEPLIISLGALMIVSAYVINWRLNARSRIACKC